MVKMVDVWVTGTVFNCGTQQEVGVLAAYIPNMLPSRLPCTYHADFKHTNSSGDGSRESKRESRETPSTMELRALCSGLSLLESQCNQQPTNETLASQKTQARETQNTLHTSSKYVIQCMTEWCQRWERHGYLTKRKRPVRLGALIQEAARIMKSHNVKLVLASGSEPEMVRAHELAAQAARRGVWELTRSRRLMKTWRCIVLFQDS